MTYDVYSVFAEGSYKVAEGNHASHTAEFAEFVCKELGHRPIAFATLTLNFVLSKENRNKTTYWLSIL
jgi:hypothetical protein